MMKRRESAPGHMEQPFQSFLAVTAPRLDRAFSVFPNGIGYGDGLVHPQDWLALYLPDHQGYATMKQAISDIADQTLITTQLCSARPGNNYQEIFHHITAIGDHLKQEISTGYLLADNEFDFTYFMRHKTTELFLSAYKTPEFKGQFNDCARGLLVMKEALEKIGYVTAIEYQRNAAHPDLYLWPNAQEPYKNGFWIDFSGTGSLLIVSTLNDRPNAEEAVIAQQLTINKVFRSKYKVRADQKIVEQPNSIELLQMIDAWMSLQYFIMYENEYPNNLNILDEIGLLLLRRVDKFFDRKWEGTRRLVSPMVARILVKRKIKNLSTNLDQK